MAYFEFRVGGAAGSSELTSGDGRGAVPRALLRALISLFHPKIFSLMLWPPLLALLLWLALSFAFWGQMAAWISQEFQAMDSVNWLFGWWPFSLLASSIGWVVLVLMFVPIVLISASIIIALVGMPIMLSHVAARDYPQLQRAQGVRHALHALLGGWLNAHRCGWCLYCGRCCRCCCWPGSISACWVSRPWPNMPMPQSDALFAGNIGAA